MLGTRGEEGLVGTIARGIDGPILTHDALDKEKTNDCGRPSDI
jgi:hypothetical protein